MTRENLIGNGAPYVLHFLWAMAAYISSNVGLYVKNIESDDEN